MSALKNLFSYATKELSQDAFLLWLINNWDCDDKEVKIISKAFINEICGIDVHNIISIDTMKQEKDMDISARITYKDGSKKALFIEDKTTSNEHNQLIKYNSEITSLNSKEKFQEIRKVFYKTHFVYDDERDRVQNAGWEIVEMNDIAEFWKRYEKSTNMIIQMYAKHIGEINNILISTIKPADNNVYLWESFFYNNVVPKLKKSIKESFNYKIEVYMKQYTYLALYPGKLSKGAPYLEVRSRECLNDDFISRVQIYYVDKKYVDIKEDMIKIMQKYGYFTTFEKKKNEIGKYKSTVVDEENFINEIIKSLQEFSKVFSEYVKNKGIR